MKNVITVCPLDCFDVCSMITTIEEGKVISVSGNKNHPITKGYICAKGRAHVKRLYHPKRVLKPMLKVNNNWEPISYDKALNIITDKINEYIESDGNQSIMNYNDCGYSGIGKSVEDMFFNHLGGITTYKGTLCWGAGAKAQMYDFGDRMGHSPEDFMNSKTIFLWGRNPAENNIHLMEHLKRARSAGAKLIVIDPFLTKTAKVADQYVQVKCGADGYLAMAMAKVIIDENWIDADFISKNVKGYEAYKAYISKLDLNELSTESGVSVDMIIDIAKAYALNTPAAIWIGYGMQRYSNGGNSIRAIDALGALTGAVGVPGAGVTYTHKSITKYIEGPLEKSEALAVHKRTYSKPKFADFVLSEKNHPIKMLFVSRANPMTQLPDINRVKKAFDTIEFKVVVDMFMTDTAKEADLVLPTTSIFEENDFIASSMYNPYLQYSEKAVEPPEGVLGEYEVFRKLAKFLKLDTYLDVDIDCFFEMQLESLCDKLSKTYSDCKKHISVLPDIDVPYKDLKFETPSGKFEMVSDLALNDGVSGHATLSQRKTESDDYKLRLLTIRSPHSTNSQHFMDLTDAPIVYINELTAEKHGVVNGEMTVIESKNGNLKIQIKVDNDIINDTVKIHQGWWHHSGCVNLLTDAEITDMGDQAAYYDTFVKIGEKTKSKN